MKKRYLMLALAPACFALSNLAAYSQALENPTNPELAEASSKPIAIERSIKIPGLNISKEDIPNMSESSAVRMACGGSFTDMYVELPKGQSPTPIPRPAPTPVPTRAKALVPVQRVSGANSTAQPSQPSTSAISIFFSWFGIHSTPTTVSGAQPVKPVLAPAATLTH